MVSFFPLTDTVEVAAVQPDTATARTLIAHAARARPRASPIPLMAMRLVLPAGQEREHVADSDRDEDHHDRDHDGVEAADAGRPEDDPQAQPSGGGEDQSHPAGC